MITRNEVGREEWDPAKFGSCGGHFAVVLSLVFSLAVVAIISKNHVLNSLWVDVAAFAIPIPVFLYFELYFENRIVRFGAFTRVAAIVLLLGAAVLFGI